MKKKIEKYFRNLARRFFERWIKVYRHRYEISLLMLTEYRGNRDLEFAIKREIANRFAEKMLDENMIEFEEENNIKTGGITIRSKIRVI